VGPLAVVNPEPSVGEGAQLRDGFEQVRVQHFGSVAPVEALDICVLIRLPRLDVVGRHTVFGAPINERLRRKFGAVVDADG
jgi:hypothetical protein